VAAVTVARATQRRCACGGIVGPEGECSACRARRLARQAGPEVAPPIVHDVLHSQGHPLQPGVRADMEARLGHDFSQVRIHDDTQAVQSARAVGARAYTVGRDVVLGASPSPTLLAHELAHVVQQGAKAPPHGRLEIGPPGDCYEREAEAVARRPAAAVAQRARPSVQRQTGGGGGSSGSTVYLCSKALESSPFGTHAFFRIGGSGAGNPTYSLEPEDRHGHAADGSLLGTGCWQGMPKRDYPEDYSASEAHCEATSLTESCIAGQYAAYPIGKYCTRGPNSNTFAGHLARRCGMANPDPRGWNPGIDDSPPAAGTYAPAPGYTVVTCMENNCIDLDHSGSADVTPSEPAVQRQQAQPQPQPVAQCGMSCTDPRFLALDRASREAQLNAQCPQGFTASATTFFGESFPAATGATLKRRMLAAQAPAMREMCLNGTDPRTLHLPGPITTYSGHSPGESQAVDIDVHGQPYLMHERSHQIRGDRTSPMVPETDIDNETRPAFNRIVFWTRYRGSIVPRGITTVSRTTGATRLTSARTWTDPLTGTSGQTTVGDLYDILSRESRALGSYFQLLAKSDAELAQEIDIFLMFNTDPPAELTRLGLPLDSTPLSVAAFRRRIADDYRILGGSAAELARVAGGRTPSTTPPTHVGDRPFEGRRPEEGFLTLPREVVVALTDQGLTWGAIDFGGGSGDVMHIDCRDIPGC